MVSELTKLKSKPQDAAVLILIVLEYGLWGRQYVPFGGKAAVLILIVLEYGLWGGFDLL